MLASSPVLTAAPYLLPVAGFLSALFVANSMRDVFVHAVDAATAKPSDDLFATPQKSGGLAAQIGSLAQPKDAHELSELRLRMIQAGFERKRALEVYSALRAVAALGLPALSWLALQPKTPLASLLLIMLTVSVGYYGPALYLHMRRKRRQDELLRPFPNALDLLVTSVEAGLGLNAALHSVADEMEAAAPLLARELQRANQEITAGVPRLDALRHLDERTGLTEMTSLVNVLVQAERYGTGVGRALRAHAELTRHKRMLAAEERAARAAPKLTIVTVLLLMPALFVILLGPTVVNVILHVIPMMTGG
jgi:tight adherence protein C